jgi:hypothetical protein
MKSFNATTTINAPPETIWRILTDAPGYPRWDPGVLRIEGTIASGNKVTAYTKRDPKRAFPAKITEFVPGHKMTWTGGMPLGLFKGVRTFTLIPRGNGSTEFTLREEYSGLLLPLIAGTIPDLTQTFEDFAAGLKAFAEKA